jgi:hypothetical protein
MNKFLTLLAFLFISQIAMAQFGYGLTITNDIYHRYTNPKTTSNNAYRSAGSAILNLGVGPKIWIGGKNTSLSLEAQAVWGMLGFAVKDFKGLGTVAYPILAKINFNGLSGLDREGRLGLSLGGGIQYARTELYGVNDKFGVERSLYRTYVVQAGYGFGLTGFGVAGFARYGWNKEKANALSIGLQWDFNADQLKKISRPESSL